VENSPVGGSKHAKSQTAFAKTTAFSAFWNAPVVARRLSFGCAPLSVPLLARGWYLWQHICRTRRVERWRSGTAMAASVASPWWQPVFWVFGATKKCGISHEVSGGANLKSFSNVFRVATEKLKTIRGTVPIAPREAATDFRQVAERVAVWGWVLVTKRRVQAFQRRSVALADGLSVTLRLNAFVAERSAARLSQEPWARWRSTGRELF